MGDVVEFGWDLHVLWWGSCRGLCILVSGADSTVSLRQSTSLFSSAVDYLLPIACFRGGLLEGYVRLASLACAVGLRAALCDLAEGLDLPCTDCGPERTGGG